ncbi:MAG: hypothetical protein QW762_04340 [Candidatus Thermoplasmatota archaeon]
MKLPLPRGVKDFDPEEMMLREKILTAKSGDEIKKQMSFYFFLPLKL